MATPKTNTKRTSATQRGQAKKLSAAKRFSLLMRNASRASKLLVFVTVFGSIGVAFLLLTHAATPLSNPMGFSAGDYTINSSAGGSNRISVDMTREIASGTDGYFTAMQIGFKGGKYGGYTGIQNNSSQGGKRALFSLWDTTSGIGEPGGTSQKFGGEGVGWQTSIPYDWQPGVAYRLSIYLDTANAGNGYSLWAGSVTNLSNGQTTRIGRIYVPTSNGNMNWVGTFHERFSGSTASCANIQPSQALFSNMTVEGPARLTSQSARSYADLPCPVTTTVVGNGYRSSIGVSSKPTSRIQGVKVDQNGQANAALNNVQVVYTCCNLAGNTNNQTANPYGFYNVDRGLHRVAITNIPTGWTVTGATICYDATNCHSTTPTALSANPDAGPYKGLPSIVIDTTNRGYADLWFHFKPTATSKIQGYKVVGTGSAVTPGGVPSAQIVYTCCNLAGNPNNQTGNPYFFYNVDQGLHRVAIANVQAGWEIIGATVCYDATNCHGNNPTPLSANPDEGPYKGLPSIVIDTRGRGYADLWFHFKRTDTGGGITTPTNTTSDPNANFTFAYGIGGYTDPGYKNQTTVYGTNTHNLNYDWGTGAPAAGMQPDWFYAAWQGTFTSPGTGTYTFYSEEDDGFLLNLNNSSANTIDKWNTAGPTGQGSANLTAGQKVLITAYMYEFTGSAKVKLYWSGPGITGRPLFPNLK